MIAEERVFRHFLENDRKLSFDELRKELNHRGTDDLIQVLSILKGKGLIDKVESMAWRLSDYARNKHNRDIEQAKKNEEKEQLQYDLLKKELQQVNLNIDDLIGKVSDYADNKWKTKWSFIISVITIILLALTTMQQLMYNKHG
jgi:hypothetical protein